MIILFVKIGRFIDKKNKISAVDSIKNLVTITPKTGTILKDGKELKTTINEIKKGDIIIVKPGEKVPVDGTILKGKTHTDESFITGEAMPVSKEIGSKVIAGSINYDGVIEFKAEKIGKDSEISNIVNMVIEATNSKAKIERLADKISGFFVPIIFLISIFSFIANYIITKNISASINSLVSVLVVACLCSLGLATPLAMVVSIGKASRLGILIKSSESIEKISKIDTIIFDKTGTLTKGKMQIVDGKFSEDDFVILQNLESKSNHPIAKCICENINKVYEVSDYEEIAGFGIIGVINNKKYFAGNSKFLEKQKIENPFLELEKEYLNKGETIVYLFDEQKAICIIGLSDEIKPNMKEVILKLQNMNKKVVMLTRR